MKLILNWFLSRSVRHALAMEQHVRRIARAQRDVLSPQALEALAQACGRMLQILRETPDKKVVEAGMIELEKAAEKWLKPYPSASLRENVEVFLVAIAVAMGIRTFFLQPFKIPTGSMQPTLYGITHENLINEPDLKVPSGLANFYESWVHGISYYHEVATADGELKSISPPKKLIFFNLWQNFQVGDTSYTVWFPPDDLMQRAGLASASRNTEGQMFFYPNPVSFKAGQDIMKLQVITGDHLFVDRVTYNFRRPQRGEVIVFETKDIPELVRRSQDKLFYIKRMVAMGGDKVQIGDDNHLIINGTRLDANTPHFERVYHFDINKPQRGSYYGHAGGAGAARAAEILKDTNLAGLAPNFPTSNAVLELPPHTYLAMGDNTLSSSDSRDWGTLPQHNVIGKSFFVYWPFTKRFGWEHLATK